MNRLSYSDLEAICGRQNCRPGDLLLIGNDVFVMLDPCEWRLPSNYRRLDLDEQGVRCQPPEVLRSLDAIEFESTEAFERARAYNATLTTEFEKLKYELYDLLIAAHPEREPPDGGRYYVELDGSSGEEVLLVCDRAESLHDRLVDSIRGTLRNGNYSLNWRVRVSFEDDSASIRFIGKDVIEATG